MSAVPLSHLYGARASRIRRTLPVAHLTVGGPAITQVLARLAAEKIPPLLGAFDSAIYRPDVFRRFADMLRQMSRPQTSFLPRQRFDLQRIKRVAGRREAQIWHSLIYDSKAVSPELYNYRSSTYRPELPKKSF